MTDIERIAKGLTEVQRRNVRDIGWADPEARLRLESKGLLINEGRPMKPRWKYTSLGQQVRTYLMEQSK